MSSAASLAEVRSILRGGLWAYWWRVIRFALLGADPRTIDEVSVWALCVPFRLWNRSARYSGQTFGDLYVKGSRRGLLRWLPMRWAYLFFLFAWPFVALARALRHGPRGAKKRFRRDLARPDLALFHSESEFSDREFAWMRPDFALGMFYAVDFAKTRRTFYALDGKLEFVEACARAGLPVPRAFTSQEAAARGGTYIVKNPTLDLGSGVFAVSAADLAELEDSSGLLIQERLRNHRALRELFGEDAPLSTFRVTTVLDPSTGEPTIWRTSIRIGRKGSDVDNTAQGGIWSQIDKNTGEILPGVTKKSFNRRSAKYPGTFSAHPDTGETFAGTKVPYWDEGRALALEAHKKLAPEAFTLGWDVGLAESGPVLLEVNVWTTVYDYDPPDDAFTLGCNGILERLAKLRSR
jgi:hypothetical protein